MGNKYTVLVWIKDGTYDNYRNKEYFRGESLVRAVLALRRAKKEGFKCIKLEYRT